MTTVNSSTSSLAQMMAMLRQSYASTSTASTDDTAKDTATTIDTKQKNKQEPFVSGQMAISGDTFSTLLASQSVNATGQAEAEADFQEAFDSWYNSIDSDGSGSVSKDEFVAAKPDTVTTDEATALYEKIDTEGTGALTETQLAYGLVSANRPAPPPPKEEDSVPSIDDMFSAMDADSDGVVTKEEFFAAKPDDVTDEQAEALYASIDTEDTGSITKEQLASSMQGGSKVASSGGGGGGGGGSSSTKKVVSETTVTNPDKSTTTTTTYSDGTTETETNPATASTSSTATEDAVDSFLNALFGNTKEPASAEEMFSQMDVDGDGIVTKEEFLTAKPDDMTDEQAEALYASIDTEGTGSITEDQLASSMQKDENRTSVASSSTSTDTATTVQTASEAFLEAILGRKSDGKSLEAILASLEASMGASLG